MGLKFNPLIYSGLQVTTASGGGGSLFFGDPVDTFGDLPSPGQDGELRVVKDTDSLYVYDATTTQWKLLSDPLTDLRQISYTGSESATFIDIPLFVFDSTVESFNALVNVEKDTTTKETIILKATKTSTTPDRTMIATGENTTIDFQVVEDGFNQLQVQYKTDPTTASYKITFRAITLT